MCPVNAGQESGVCTISGSGSVGFQELLPPPRPVSMHREADLADKTGARGVTFSLLAFQAFVLVQSSGVPCTAPVEQRKLTLFDAEDDPDTNSDRYNLPRRRYMGKILEWLWSSRGNLYQTLF